MTTCAWLWIYAGAILMLLELLASGFIVFFFGLSAASVGLMRFVFGEAFDATWQLAAFSGFSLVYLFVLRRWFKRTFLGGKVETATDFDNEFVGRVGKVTEAIMPPETGRVLIGDAAWTAAAKEPLAVGVSVKVLKQDNLTMWVAPVA